jgi:hypothetical protein
VEGVGQEVTHRGRVHGHETEGVLPSVGHTRKQGLQLTGGTPHGEELVTGVVSHLIREADAAQVVGGAEGAAEAQAEEGLHLTLVAVHAVVDGFEHWSTRSYTRVLFFMRSRVTRMEREIACPRCGGNIRLTIDANEVRVVDGRQHVTLHEETAVQPAYLRWNPNPPEEHEETRSNAELMSKIRLDVVRMVEFKRRNLSFDVEQGTTIVLFSNEEYLQIKTMKDPSTRELILHKIREHALYIVGLVDVDVQ